jgi:hypothetical protein
MVRLCQHTFPDTRSCANPALRDTLYCRHHQPVLEPSDTDLDDLPAPEPDADNTPDYIQRWREIGFAVPTMTIRQLDAAFSEILNALADDTISHRAAGRLLQLIIRRREARLAFLQRRQAAAAPPSSSPLDTLTPSESFVTP